jgi:DNA-directed RNA polymerase subunit beta'
MMLDSGARGSKEQIRQLTGMRGLMAKPKNQLLVVKLLKIQFFLTLKKVLFLSTLFLLTVLVKVLRILLENGGCRIPNKKAT